MTWLVENWKLILEAVIFIASVVLLILKKKPVKVLDGTKDKLDEYIRSCILEAEEVWLEHGTGSEKKAFVVAKAIQYIHLLLGLDEKDAMTFKSYIADRVEYFLSTPSKKGEKDEK